MKMKKALMLVRIVIVEDGFEKAKVLWPGAVHCGFKPKIATDLNHAAQSIDTNPLPGLVILAAAANGDHGLTFLDIHRARHAYLGARPLKFDVLCMQLTRDRFVMSARLDAFTSTSLSTARPRITPLLRTHAASAAYRARDDRAACVVPRIRCGRVHAACI
ncbi:MAG: hypothetical protein CBHOC_4079 [uncultured Caballeronia sp.]|nr:MAG: hypothetical protein CBHOC_4079 [uncultured Caballeronia sp.]